ncbi:MAG: hypothetical protein Q9159_006454 [Coniocarpon cinnabarinum]
MSDNKTGKLFKHEGAASSAQPHSEISPTLQQQRQALNAEQKTELQRMEERVRHAIENAGNVWQRLKHENSMKTGDDKRSDGQLIHDTEMLDANFDVDQKRAKHHFKLFGRYPEGYEEEERARREESHQRMRDDFKEMFPGATNKELEQGGRERFYHDMLRQDQHGQLLEEGKQDPLSLAAHTEIIQKLMEGPTSQGPSNRTIAASKDRPKAGRVEELSDDEADASGSGKQRK